MTYNLLAFPSVMLTALAMGSGLAHVLELSRYEAEAAFGRAGRPLASALIRGILVFDFAGVPRRTFHGAAMVDAMALRKHPDRCAEDERDQQRDQDDEFRTD